MRLSAVEQAARVRSGEVSARELVEASLAAVERHNPRLNAFVTLCAERALDEADAVGPGDRRPLCGVPVGIKDLLSATEGTPTTEGSHAFGDWIADHDSAHVRRLREAGAIVVGKTNSPELGLRPVTENLRFGATCNPWNPNLSAGGSSGGARPPSPPAWSASPTAAISAARSAFPRPAAAWSASSPASAGFDRPDFGDLAAGMPCDGVLTRTVRDAAVALDAIAGAEPGDRHRAPARSHSFVDAAQSEPGRAQVRVALNAPLGVPVDDEPRAAAVGAAEALASLGHDVREATPAWHDESFPASWATYMTGTGQHLLRVVERLHGRSVEPELLEPATRAWLLDAERVSSSTISRRASASGPSRATSCARGRPTRSSSPRP